MGYFLIFTGWLARVIWSAAYYRVCCLCNGCYLFCGSSCFCRHFVWCRRTGIFKCVIWSKALTAVAVTMRILDIIILDVVKIAKFALGAVA